MHINNFQQFYNQIIPFLKRYGVFIAPLLLFIFFMFLLIFSYTSKPKQTSTAGPLRSKNPTIVNISPVSPSEGETISISPEASESPKGIEDDEKTLTIWSAFTLSDDDFSGLNATKTTLSDGSTQYSYDSDVPNRPNVIILKNGINVFQRTPFTQTAFSDNSNYYGKPDYITKGSQFWGLNAVTYIYLSKGIALVGDTSKDQLFEQIIFQPSTLDQFIQQDTDIIGQPQKP